MNQNLGQTNVVRRFLALGLATKPVLPELPAPEDVERIDGVRGQAFPHRLRKDLHDSVGRHFQIGFLDLLDIESDEVRREVRPSNAADEKHMDSGWTSPFRVVSMTGVRPQPTVQVSKLEHQVSAKEE